MKNATKIISNIDRPNVYPMQRLIIKVHTVAIVAKNLPVLCKPVLIFIIFFLS